MCVCLGGSVFDYIWMGPLVCLEPILDCSWRYCNTYNYPVYLVGEYISAQAYSLGRNNRRYSYVPITLNVYILDCSSTPDIVNASPFSSGNVTYTAKLHTKCNKGYELSGNATITCQANRNWTALPTCDITSKLDVYLYNMWFEDVRHKHEDPLIDGILICLSIVSAVSPDQMSLWQ